MSERTQSFEDFGEWVDNASFWLTNHPDFNEGVKNHWERYTAICFDTNGRICRNGADFMRARDEGAFPVRWLWPDQVPGLFLAIDKFMVEGKTTKYTLAAEQIFRALGFTWEGYERPSVELKDTF